MHVYKDDQNQIVQQGRVVALRMISLFQLYYVRLIFTILLFIQIMLFFFIAVRAPQLHALSAIALLVLTEHAHVRPVKRDRANYN